MEKNVVRDVVYLGGMCPRCEGTGAVSDFDLAALYDETMSLSEGALTLPGYSMDGWYGRIFSGAGLDMDKPIGKFGKKELDELLYREPTKIKVEGINLTYEGVIPKIQKSMLSKDVDAMQPHIRAFVERAITFQTCPECEGTRLTKAVRPPRSRAGTSPTSARCRSATWPTGWGPQGAVGGPAGHRAATPPRLLRRDRAWLPLARPALGHAVGRRGQRTKMIRHLGSSLTDVTYVFDEPTIGLHPHDIERMNDLLLQLRDKGNTVLVVEHKPETIAIADHVVDLGPAPVRRAAICLKGTVEGCGPATPSTGRISTTGRC